MVKEEGMVLEFLLTYGWAVLIVVVVVISLFAMNIFSPSAFMPEKAMSCEETFGGVQNDCNVKCDCVFTCENVSTSVSEVYEVI